MNQRNYQDLIAEIEAFAPSVNLEALRALANVFRELPPGNITGEHRRALLEALGGEVSFE